MKVISKVLYFKKAVLLTVFFFITFLNAADNANVRGLWVVRYDISNSKDIDKLLDFSTKNNITDIYFQVRGRGDAYYKSSIVPQANIVNNGFDPLNYILYKSANKKIRIHAWLNTYFLWSAPKLPQSKKHIINKHPEWLDENLSKYDENKMIYLSPGLGDVNIHLTKVILELVSNYDIDGIHLDYVRYYNRYSGYHKLVRKEYQKVKSIDPITIETPSFNDKDPMNNQSYHEWSKFRAGKITCFLSDLDILLNEYDNKLILSCAVKPNLHLAYNINFQDWKKWLETNIVDYVIIMNYSNDIEDFSNNLYICNSLNKYDNIYVGIGLWNQNLEVTKSEVKISLTEGYENFVFFSYNVFQNNKEYDSSLFQYFNKDSFK